MILFPQEASKDMIGRANARARPTVIGGETMAGCGRLDPGGSALKVTPGQIDYDQSEAHLRDCLDVAKPPRGSSVSGERIVGMTLANDDELQALRRRAYGPNTDIHLDPHALERLRELEGVVREQHPVSSADSSGSGRAPVEQPLPIEDETEPSAKESLRPMMRVRRSSLLIVLGVAVVSTILAGALVLVQLSQTDPLQVGTKQIARLSVDPAFKISPFFFGTTFSRDLQAQGFQEFNGLRTVVTVGYGGGSNDACLNIYPSAVATDPKASSFAGQLRVGCAAGMFPAIVQFRVDAAGLPADLRSAFPKSAALQFVYDSAHNEVVVFAEK